MVSRHRFLLRMLTLVCCVGEILAKRTREHYLKAVLRQDITFFDKVGAGEIATRIQTDTRRHSRGILDSYGCFTKCPRFNPRRYFRESTK